MVKHPAAIAGFLFACLLQAAPARIVSTFPSVTETVFALGAGNRLVGVSTYCRYPPAALAIPKIGTYMKPDPEKIALLRPDLVIIDRSATALADRLSALGIQHASIRVGTLAEVYSMILAIGTAIDARETAEELNKSIKARLNQIRDKTKDMSHPKVLILVGRTPGLLTNLIAVGPGTYLGELLAIAGGSNILTDTKISYPHISLEAVLRLNPDVILDASNMGDGGPDISAQNARLREPWMTHTDIAAVQRNMVFGLVSETLVTPGPRVADAVQLIQNSIYPPMSALLCLKNISFLYSERKILDNVSFSANRGEFLVLLGVNGAGKTTLLDCIAGLRSPDVGEVLLDGRALASWSARDRARRISHLPQGTRTELPFTVEQVVLMGRYAHADKWFESEHDRAYASDAIKRLDCLQFRQRLYGTLSGGEQQRVLLAACIAQGPQIMLFDEPSTYLDVHQQLQCFATLAELTREGALCIAVTHDVNLALAHCTRLLILDGGKIAADVASQQAADNPNWLPLLSPELRMAHTPEGRPWVLYR